VNFFAQIQGSLHCLVAISSCFDFVVNFTRFNLHPTIIVCIIYEVAATCTCTNLSIFCLVRVLGVTNSSLLEENVSEKMLFYAVVILDTASTSLVLGSIFIAGELPKGSIYSLATHQVIPGGELFMQTISDSTYISLIWSC